MNNNNDTLLISEVQGKVILPYTSSEVEEILKKQQNNENVENDENSENGKDFQRVVEDFFTRPFSDYKIAFVSRYKEAMQLAREREGFGFSDSISLAVEMAKKKYLHPAIISACKTLNELDVYLDCLDKNELDDFKIFKIKYEVYPMLVKEKKQRKIEKIDEPDKPQKIKKLNRGKGGAHSKETSIFGRLFRFRPRNYNEFE